MVPEVDWLNLDLLTIKKWAESVNVRLVINLLDLTHLLRIIRSTVDFEDSLVNSLALCIDHRIYVRIKILVCAQEEVTLLNKIENGRLPST